MALNGFTFTPVAEAVQVTQRRQQQAENTGRMAQASLVYKTSGAGQMMVAKAVTFDTQFVEEPRCTTGAFLDARPDPKLWRLPQITSGVYKWQTKKVTGDTTLWTGAYLFFGVHSDPLQLPRTDGSNLEDIKKAAAKVASDPAKTATYKKLIAEAELALKLTDEPPVVEVTHHLTFTGVALKSLSDDVEDALHTSVQPRPTRL